MQQLEGTIADYLKNYIEDLKKPKEERKLDIYIMKATKEQFDEFFDSYDFVCLRYPENMKLDGFCSFNRKTNPERVRYAYPIDFYKNPNKKFKIDSNYEKKNGKILTKEDKEKKLREERQKKEDELRESMKKDGCELVSKYTKASEPVYYVFEGREYRTTPTKWKAGHRAHQMQFSRYTPNYVKKCFADEGCELLTEYKNSKQVLFYIYKNARYSTTFNDWLWYHNRPHLGRKKTFFTEDYEEP